MGRGTSQTEIRVNIYLRLDLSESERKIETMGACLVYLNHSPVTSLTLSTASNQIDIYLS